MTRFWFIIFLIILPLAMIAFFAIRSLFKTHRNNKDYDVPDIDIPGIDDF
jgi:ABC-type Na+ efflux pump permease subunit